MFPTFAFPLDLAHALPFGVMIEHASSERREEDPEAWMARYQAGDLGAFEALYRTLSPPLFGYLLRLTRRRDLAEDLVQITFAKVHRARLSYLIGAPVLPWLLAIGRRSFLDECRRKKTRPEDLSRDGVLPDPDPKNSMEAADSDLSDALDQALNRLPAQYGEAIQLLKISGLSIAEAAEVLGTTPSAVKLRAHRGYVLLRKELERFGRHDS